jgi:hypothetical protein
MKKEQDNRDKNFKEIAVLATLLTGASGSLYFMLMAGSQQKSILLILLFTGWVLSPFAGLLLVKYYAGSLNVYAGKTINRVFIIMPALSILAYSGLLLPAGTKPAFIFIVFPLACWVAIILLLLFTRKKR